MSLSNFRQNFSGYSGEGGIADIVWWYRTLYLRILAPFYFVVSAKLVADGILRGAGLMKQFMIATFTDLILRVVLAIVLSKTALLSTGIWCAWPIGWTVATVISIFFYRQGKWKEC